MARIFLNIERSKDPNFYLPLLFPDIARVITTTEFLEQYHNRALNPENFTEFGFTDQDIDFLKNLEEYWIIYVPYIAAALFYSFQNLDH